MSQPRSDNSWSENTKAAAAAVELHATDKMIIGGSIGPTYAKGQDGLLRAVASSLRELSRSRPILA